MTVTKIADNAKLKGFIVDTSKGYHILKFLRRDNLFVELSFPPDDMNLKNGQAISWEFHIFNNKTKEEVYKDWREMYGNNSLIDMYEDIDEFIINISTNKLRITQKPFITFLKWKFGKYDELEFKTEKGWEIF